MCWKVSPLLSVNMESGAFHIYGFLLFGCSCGANSASVGLGSAVLGFRPSPFAVRAALTFLSLFVKALLWQRLGKDLGGVAPKPLPGKTF